MAVTNHFSCRIPLSILPFISQWKCLVWLMCEMKVSICNFVHVMMNKVGLRSVSFFVCKLFSRRWKYSNAELGGNRTKILVCHMRYADQGTAESCFASHFFYPKNWTCETRRPRPEEKPMQCVHPTSSEKHWILGEESSSENWKRKMRLGNLSMNQDRQR